MTTNHAMAVAVVRAVAVVVAVTTVLVVLAVRLWWCLLCWFGPLWLLRCDGLWFLWLL